MTTPAKKFRQCFNIHKEKINWYPGHMSQSFKHMQALMRKIDCVIEVHDSRIPFSGRNPKFLNSLIGPKPHILVLNKKDLINSHSYLTIKEKCLEENCENVVFTNCRDKTCEGVKHIIPLAVKLIHGVGLYPKEGSGHRLMVVGVPNVGKSSLINILRNLTLARGKATAVGPLAGVTRTVQNEVKISSDPPIYLIDTPGILTPKISDIECGMKLALCSCLNDSVVGTTLMADFLLYWFNKTGNFTYVDYFGLNEPLDDIFPLLLKIAVKEKHIKKIRSVATNQIQEIPDLQAAAGLMVSKFRKGEFGDLYFDQNYLNSYENIDHLS